MDSLIVAAGRALSLGDPLGALKRVALRDDPPALALRGIAMAQLGELDRARELLRRAARGFGSSEPLSRARCVTAEAEVALAARDLTWSPRALETSLTVLRRYDDQVNVLHARSLQIRRLLLVGRIDRAEQALASTDWKGSPPALQAMFELARADVALRRVQTREAKTALVRARVASERAGIPALIAEVKTASLLLEVPSARSLERGVDRPLVLAEVEALLDSDDLVIDACRRTVRVARRIISWLAARFCSRW